VSWDFVYGTNMQHGFLLSRQLLARQTGTKQIIMITDGEPTAHIEPAWTAVLQLPAGAETVDATLREVARCTKDGIRINTFMLDATPLPAGLRREAHRDEPGPGLLHHPETLGDYVLVDFIERTDHHPGRGARAVRWLSAAQAREESRQGAEGVQGRDGRGQQTRRVLRRAVERHCRRHEVGLRR
jgi:hypothetical protein